MPSGRPGYVVDVQSRLLDELSTRVVIPLIPKATAPAIPVKTLNPLFSIDDGEYVLMTQNMAAVPNAQLRISVGTLAAQRDHIVHAIDALLSGI
jgi:toxin CcdB